MKQGPLVGRVNLLRPWLRRHLGAPLVKISLDAGLGCPNRDGTLGRKGCLFCPPSGSGRGQGALSISAQLQRFLGRLQKGRGARPRVMAYFQAWSNTHASPQHLARLYRQALDTPGVDGLAIATRPDCLDPDRWQVLADFARQGLFWLELGLQSAHDDTLAAIGRGHDVACFDRALAEANRRGIKVVAHVILGLPGEGLLHTRATARHLARQGVWGLKLHNLMVLAGSRLAAVYRAGQHQPWARQQYLAAAADFLAHLPPEVVIHRLAADPGLDQLLAPAWAADKAGTLAALGSYMQEQNLRQGDRWQT